MTRQPVDRDHSDPIVHGIGSSAEGCSIEKPVPEGANVPECFLAEKNEEVGIVNGPGVPRDLSETPRDVRESWRLQPGPCEENAQGIDVIAKRSTNDRSHVSLVSTGACEGSSNRGSAPGEPLCMRHSNLVDRWPPAAWFRHRFDVDGTQTAPSLT